MNLRRHILSKNFPFWKSKGEHTTIIVASTKITQLQTFNESARCMISTMYLQDNISEYAVEYLFSPFLCDFKLLFSQMRVWIEIRVPIVNEYNSTVRLDKYRRSHFLLGGGPCKTWVERETQVLLDKVGWNKFIFFSSSIPPAYYRVIDTDLVLYLVSFHIQPVLCGRLPCMVMITIFCACDFIFYTND